MHKRLKGENIDLFDYPNKLKIIFDKLNKYGIKPIINSV